MTGYPKGTVNRLLLTLLLVAAAACSGSTDVKIPKVSGGWSGIIAGTTNSANLTLVEDAAGSITGSGNLVSSVTSVALTVTGTHADPSISMILASTGFSSVNYQGKVISATLIRGTLQGSGFVGDSLILTKAP
jgi:hypothetical protein